MIEVSDWEIERVLDRMGGAGTYRTMDLYDEYHAWSQEAGQETASKNALVQTVKSFGAIRAKVGDDAAWQFLQPFNIFSRRPADPPVQPEPLIDPWSTPEEVWSAGSSDTVGTLPIREDDRA